MTASESLSATPSRTLNATLNATPNATPNATWTTERVALLRGYVGAGLSCAQIAREIGVTRNAVIGKISRLGLTGPRRAASALPRPPAAPRRRSGVIALRRILRAMQAEPLPVAEDAIVESATRCSLHELAEGNCRWPTGDPGGRDFGFCGGAAIAGLPYCAGHARLAYRRTAQRRA